MKKLILGVLYLWLISCSPQEKHKESTPLYFDIAGYFNGEINRLQKANPTLTKEVVAKNKSEQKTTKITDWKIELTSFSSADINKASWRGEFKETTVANGVVYTTENPKIPIKKVEVLKIGETIKGIKIFKTNNNYLYNSTDTLFYYPDSLYLIQNQQKVKLLSVKNYKVIGRF